MIIETDFATCISERIKGHMNWKIKYLGISWMPDILCTFNEIALWLMAFAFPDFFFQVKSKFNNYILFELSYD